MKKLYLILSLTFVLFFSIKSFAVPQLNSLPGATAVIFLDFDGHYVQSVVWNAGSPINCAAATMSETQITEAFNRTAEDFRPFDINITTDSVVFLAAALNHHAIPEFKIIAASATQIIGPLCTCSGARKRSMAS